MKRLPEVGETVAADNNIFKAFGGKGANQAIACARLMHYNHEKVEEKNKYVSMLGQIGNDCEGQSFI